MALTRGQEFPVFYRRPGMVRVAEITPRVQHLWDQFVAATGERQRSLGRLIAEAGRAQEPDAWLSV